MVLKFSKDNYLYNNGFFLALSLIYIFNFFISCKRDLGTKKLSNVDGYNLIISGLDSDYVIAMGDTLKIVPIVSKEDGTIVDTNDYTFFWTETSVLNGAALSGSGAIDSISGKNFVYPLSFDNPYAAGISTWTYKIISKKTGIFTQKTFTISPYSPTSEGFYVLSQTGINKSRLSMIYYNPASEKYDTAIDILATMYAHERIAPPYSLKGNPISVNYGTSWLARYFGDFISVITDQDGTMLNASDLTLRGNGSNTGAMANFSTLLGNVIPDYTPAAIRSYASSVSYGYGIINYNGYLYEDKGIYGNNETNFEESPLTIPGGTTKVMASKWIGTNDNLIKASENVPYFILFDDNRQVFYNYYNTNLSNLPIDNFSAKRKLIYNHYTDYGGGRYYAIMKSNTSDSTFLLSFSSTGEKYADNFLNINNIDTTTHFAISASYGYIFYNIGNQIYEYDLVKNKSYAMFSYPGKTVSYMEGPQIPWNINMSDRTVTLSQSIIIATYDPSNLENSGIVDIYSVPSANEVIQKQNTYSGFGKIVSMTYKQIYN